MKIIFLNCWSYGHIFPKALDYLAQLSNTVDVFCLSEITPQMDQQLQEKLKGFKSLPALNKDLANSRHAPTMYIQNKYENVTYHQHLLYESTEEREVPGQVQRVDIKLGEKLIKIGNLQGMAYPGNKKDNERRLKQSQDIITFMGDPNNAIVGGDFNLMPDTKSIAMFEEAGYRNLIKEYGIKETRNRLAWEQFKHKPDFEVQHYADYCFVSPQIKIKSFEVPDVEVSDHLPLILEFEI